ncbi:ABC transporter substrate-binding protein [Streptomyces sp. 1331.2]|uniref:ABC transporter substrate-binding protein n=1 Tax=Streptomyces sp. 1331.2 TaxID=1938835 RepID=UPI000BDBFDBB|nr:ABC transporter substrate-binding protein [Streptomyces sp. 1331.2]SOB84185.1 peptide/nickel transport system substrate-binding protein [Streptomyces sp. 1331.2]
MPSRPVPAAQRSPRRSPRPFAVPPAVPAAGLAAVLLAGCSSGGPTGTGAGPAAAPVRGGTLKYAVAVGTSCLDPHVSPGDVTAVIQRNVFDSLVYLDDKGGFHPWLAKSWQVSPDARTYTFRLRDGVAFHDGTVFDAAAVKANLDHIKDPRTKSLYAASLLGPYTGAEVVDPHTVRVSFSEPYVPFLQAAATPYLGIASPKSLAEKADQLCAGGANSVGTGPFKETEYVKNDHVEFRRNDAYAWAPEGAANQGAPYLDGLTIRFLPEDSVRSGALTSRQVDAAALPVTAVRTVRAANGIEVSRTQNPGVVYSLFLNTTRGALQDERVRRAVQRAVDVDALVRSIYFGEYERAWSPLSPTTPAAYEAGLKDSFPHDAAAAGRLLDEAGWSARDADGYRVKDGKRLTLHWPYIASLVRDQRDTLAAGIQADLKKAGIELVRDSIDNGTYFTIYASGDYDLWDNSWVRADPAVLAGFYLSTNTPAAGGQNVSLSKDPELDGWLRAGAATTDPAARKGNYTKAERWAVEHATVLPLYVTTNLVGRAQGVQGLVFDANAWPQFAGVWKTR